jgi:hypothetical protein
MLGLAAVPGDICVSSAIVLEQTSLGKSSGGRFQKELLGGSTRNVIPVPISWADLRRPVLAYEVSSVECNVTVR